MWLYGSGFPKSMDIEKSLNKKDGVEFESIKWKGWGTCLKPAFEPIIVARKPFKGSLVDNVIQYGVGGINIDECRVAFENGEENSSIQRYNSTQQKGNNGWQHINRGANFNEDTKKSMQLGRFPANTILTYDETDFEEVCGGFPNTKGNGNIRHNKNDGKGYNCYSNYKDCETKGYEDSGSTARYFYCAKASKKDRDEGLDKFENVSGADITGRKEGSAGLVMENGKQNPFAGKASPNNKNTHPTVKPTELMQYLIRLVTPNGGVILDPFMGSGSTGKAVVYENRERNKNFDFIGIEKEEEYYNIAKARIENI